MVPSKHDKRMKKSSNVMNCVVVVVVKTVGRGARVIIG